MPPTAVVIIRKRGGDGGGDGGDGDLDVRGGGKEMVRDGGVVEVVRKRKRTDKHSVTTTHTACAHSCANHT